MSISLILLVGLFAALVIGGSKAYRGLSPKEDAV